MIGSQIFGKFPCSLVTDVPTYPFEVVVSHDPPSAVLADQVESLDWRARKAARKGKVDPDILAEVQAKIRALLML